MYCTEFSIPDRQSLRSRALKSLDHRMGYFTLFSKSKSERQSQQHFLQNCTCHLFWLLIVFNVSWEQMVAYSEHHSLHCEKETGQVREPIYAFQGFLQLCHVASYHLFAAVLLNSVTNTFDEEILDRLILCPRVANSGSILAFLET